jgi:hypothetical protein
MIELLKLALEALKLAVMQNEHDMLMTGEEIHKCVVAGIGLSQAIAEAEKQEGQSNFCAQCEALSRELKAIKQEQGEPVGYLEIDDIESQREYPHNCRNVNLWYESGEGLVAVYTHPPQRTWVGLTKDEVDSWNLPDHPTVFEFAQFIEAKLKEKNT